MFGFSKPKALDYELLKKNVPETVINLWMNDNTLKFEKFTKEPALAPAFKDKDIVEKFITEKLYFIVAVMMILLLKAGVENVKIQELIAIIDKEVHDTDSKSTLSAELHIMMKAKEYASIRMSVNTRDAGRLVEDKFSQEVFGRKCSSLGTDSQYLIYKSLSALERTAILRISAAARQSRT